MPTPLLWFAFEAMVGSAALKRIPAISCLIILASNRVGVDLRRCSHRGVPQTLRYDRQRHAIRQEVRAVRVAQRVEARALGKT